jgi:hypothetical protein
MDAVLHNPFVLAQIPAPSSIISWIEKGGVVAVVVVVAVAIAGLAYLAWKVYANILKPAQEAAVKVAEFNATAMLASRDGMQAFERASTTQKAITDQEQKNLDRHEKLIERQERVTDRLVAHTGDSGEDDGGNSVRFAPRSK